MTREEYEKLGTEELQSLLKQKEIEVSKQKVMQMGLKVTLNSAYGMIGNQYSRYYDLRIAEGITVSGQLSIRWIERKVNEYLNKILGTKDESFVIAGDTDSIYFTLKPLVDRVADGKSKKQIVRFLDKVCSEKIEPFIEASYKELADYMNAFQQKMKMKREVIADRGIWRAKKNYILNVHNSEGVQYEEPKLKIMGIESVRSSTPEICRNGIKDCLKIVMNETEEASQIFIEEFRTKFMSSLLEDISFPRGISDIDKWSIGDNEPFKSKTPVHVKASITYNRLIRKFKLEKKYRLIQNGDKIKFSYLSANNPTNNNAIAFLDILPPEFKLDKHIDRVLQYQKSFLEPMRSIFGVIGWSTEHVIDIFDELFEKEDEIEYSEMLNFIKKHGWVEYYHGNCVKEEWIKSGKPYDRMVCSVEDTYQRIINGVQS